MKKATLLLLAALLLFTAACSSSGGESATTTTTAAPAHVPSNYPTDDTYYPETDDPYFRTGANAGSMVAEVENGFYFLLDSTLLYADADAMEPIPVCAKPNCLHNRETDPGKMAECNAYFRSAGIEAVFYYNTELYVFYSTGFGYELTQVSADGTSRSTVFALNKDFVGKTCLHRGKFYAVYESSNERGFHTAELWSYDLKKPTAEPQLLYCSEEQVLNHFLCDSLCAFGNYLYFREYVVDDTAGKYTSLRILEIDSGEWTVVDPPTGYTVGQHTIVDGRLLIVCRRVGGSALYNTGETPQLDAPMLICDLDGRNAEELAYGTWGATTADATYIYMNSPMLTEVKNDGSYVRSTPTDRIYFYDTELDLVDELYFQNLKRSGTKLLQCTVFPTRGEYVFLLARYDDMLIFYYIKRSEIGTKNISPVEFLNYAWNEYSFAGN